MKILSLIIIVPFTIFLFTNLTFADSQQTQTIYGWQLMAPQERFEHRQKMQSLKTQQEREAFRLEHHKKMQQRAQEKGITLPDEPLQRNRGMEPGQGMGSGGGQGLGGGGGRR